MALGVIKALEVQDASVASASLRELAELVATKEAARLELAANPVAGADLVLIGREATRTRDFRDLRDDLRRALRKAGVIRVEGSGRGPGGTPALVLPVQVP